MTVSLGVCQWNGATQPGANFARITLAPLLGSPRSTEIVKQSGALAAGPNFAAAAVATMTLSSDVCAERFDRPNTAAKAVRRTAKRSGDIKSLLKRNRKRGRTGVLAHNLLEYGGKIHACRQRRLSASSSSSVRGQSEPSSRESPRSASNFPPVWHRAQ